MKKIIKLILPILCQFIFVFGYNSLRYNYLEEIIGWDHILFCDGREVDRFGIGSLSVCFIILLMIICIVWILKNNADFKKKKSLIIYRIISILFILTLSIFWIVFYIKYYSVIL